MEPQGSKTERCKIKYGAEKYEDYFLSEMLTQEKNKAAS